MSIIRADSIKNRSGDGAPDFPNGITITGVVTATTLNSVSNNIDVDDFIEVGNNIQLGNAGVVTATTFVGNLTGNPTGTLQTAAQPNITSVGTLSSLNVSGNVSIGGTLTYEDVTNIDSVGIVTARTGVITPNVDVDDFISVGSNIHLGNAGVVTATSFSGNGSALTGITQTTINSNADNRIITGSGTANTLNAEASFTFDSGVADITGKLRIDVDSTSGAGSGSVEAIFLRNTNETDGNAVTIFAGADDYAAAASAINFINIDHSANTGAITFDTRKTGNVYAEKMRISSEGYVTKPHNVCFMVRAAQNQSYSGGGIFIPPSPVTTGVCHNDGNHFNTSTGVFTAPVAGKYYLSMDCGISFLSDSPTDGWQITMQKNGSASEVSDLLFAGGYNGFEDHVRADGILKLAANDQVRWHMNGYGGSMNMVGMKFQGYLVG